MTWLQRIAKALDLRPEQLMTPPPMYKNVAERANDQHWRNPGLPYGVQPIATSEIIEVEGDEMGDTLRPGDVVVIDKTRTIPSPSGIFAIRQQGATIVRRLHALADGQVQVSCDNKVYSPVAVELSQLEVVGRAVARVVRM
jgi:phage repressor protein C with HTH and peptisase S24 domain